MNSKTHEIRYECPYYHLHCEKPACNRQEVLYDIAYEAAIEEAYHAGYEIGLKEAYAPSEIFRNILTAVRVFLKERINYLRYTYHHGGNK